MKQLAYKQTEQKRFLWFEEEKIKDMIRDLNIHERCGEHKEEMMIHYFYSGSRFKI